MRILSIIILGLSLSNCNNEVSKQSVNPCHEFVTPDHWICYERINYEFCFPEAYYSETYFFSRSEPSASLSKGIFIDHVIKDIDPDQYVTLPFPEKIELPDNNAISERMEICDQGDIIGVFYYGETHFIDALPYIGYLYLRSDDTDPKYYLSANSECSKEGMEDLLKSIIRIKRKH
ncbi:MAG: hypothetical protein IPP15_22865 [Saprospiraceae bacterium]|uniref:Uncharacterized protein n=1 Tax=Candidatus Opimibacter skivensis TaxID=2982028 RepID=A0A9D7XQ24_9BACT|nr:hypothetical protein [Candidatus Opimibacter skivensis]